MNQFQPMQFRSVEEFLDFLPENELAVVEYLRQLVYDCIPGVREKLAYNVPYFYGNSRICFIWPAAVPWGKVPQNGIKLGFCKGHLLNNELAYLEQEHRKEVSWKTFHQVPVEDEDILKTYLFDAAAIDQLLPKKKRK